MYTQCIHTFKSVEAHTTVEELKRRNLAWFKQNRAGSDGHWRKSQGRLAGQFPRINRLLVSLGSRATTFRAISLTHASRCAPIRPCKCIRPLCPPPPIYLVYHPVASLSWRCPEFVATSCKWKDRVVVSGGKRGRVLLDFPRRQPFFLLQIVTRSTRGSEVTSKTFARLFSRAFALFLLANARWII